MMRRVSKRNSKPEILVRSLVHRMGWRFSLHRRDLPGTPDIVLRRRHAIILVHGCFWHQHQGCKHATRPLVNLEYWEPKLARNAARDVRVKAELEALGWQVIVVWECETKDTGALADRLARGLKARE